MKALTLQRPWGFAIARLGKRIENRTWCPPAHLIGERIAIHNGKGFDRAGWEWLFSQYQPEWPSYDRAADTPMAIIATAVVDRVISISDDIWFFGPFGWQIADVQVLPRPLECRGAQGLWNVPGHLLVEPEFIGGSR
jgi:hypothetical protein